MVEKQLDCIKTHLGRSSQSVFGVHYYLLAGYARNRRCSRPPQFALVAELAATAGTACVTLVNTSVYLKPTKLLNVALDMLARLTPCLNLRVRELGHKDLLDTIGADNRRK